MGIRIVDSQEDLRTILVARLKEKVSEHGNQHAAAEAYGVVQSVISKIVTGRMSTERLLEYYFDWGLTLQVDAEGVEFD